jgi:hypothetical protein
MLLGSYGAKIATRVRRFLVRIVEGVGGDLLLALRHL